MIMARNKAMIERIRTLALASAMCLAAPAALGDPQVGVNAAIRNSVQEKSSADANLHPAVVRAPVHLGDSVVSGDKSALQLLLLDQSVFTVGANARVTIDRFVYDPNKGASDVAASVATGAFRFMSGHSLAGFGHNAITTPVATIGVRGTILEGVVGPGAAQVLGQQSGAPSIGDGSGATLVVLIGPGLGSQGFDKPGAIDVTADGQTISLDKPGEALVIPGPGQAPIGPFFLSEGALAALSGLLLPPPDSGPDQTNFTITTAGGDSGETLPNGAPGDPYNTTIGTVQTPPPGRESEP
jgi:hypothetical protein